MDTATGISRERLEQALQHSTFAQLLGAELLDFAPGKVSLQVRSRPDLCQHHGYLPVVTPRDGERTQQEHGAFQSSGVSVPACERSGNGQAPTTARSRRATIAR